MKRLFKFARENRNRFETLLRKLVEIPTVSADPNKRQQFQRAAMLASELLRMFGADVKIHRTGGNPILVGEFRATRAMKTLTIYNHLDVQPAQETEWKQDPFRFVKRGGRYFGRGTTDDKGPALTALFASAFAQQQCIPLNIRFLWEMEEEIGSPNFEAFVRNHKASLKSDAVLVVDSVWISRHKPTIYYALRGNITGSMILETARTDVHSGVAGGVARNPMAELMDLAAKLQDAKSGKVNIPGFYKTVRPLQKRELMRFRDLGFNLNQWAKAYGLKRLRVNNGQQALIRSWCRPTFEVHGIVGGYIGAGVKTAIPPQAELKFSTRLVPDQKPEEICRLIVRDVKKHNPDVQVRIHSKLLPYLGSVSGPYIAAAEDALRFGFGRTPVFARAGGSDGAVAVMQKHLKAPIILLGLSLPEHGYHAPNENFDWRQAYGGMKTFVRFFTNIAEM
jgi:acetylornithine deacetylase/succinyl-diaminopimelate desuccinylase-like protein